MKIVLTAAVTALGLAAAISTALAADIYKWTDEHGRVHYSNHGAGSESPGDSAGGDSTEQGWESVLERKQGGAEFDDKAEATINSLSLQMIRKKRDRALAQEALEATQANIVRATTANPPDVPALRAREATQITELRKIDAEIASMAAGVAKIRALKSVDKGDRAAQ